MSFFKIKMHQRSPDHLLGLRGPTSKGREKRTMVKRVSERRICQYASQCHFVSPCQISCRSVNPVRRYGRLFQAFKMAAVLYLRCLKGGNINCPYPSDGQCASSSQISRRSVKSLSRYDRLLIFQNDGRRHLGF